MSGEVKKISIRKVYPSVSELNSVNNSVKCLEEGCNNIFTSESNLSMHMIKCHKKQDLMKSEDCIIHHHCPEITCIYHNIRHFKKFKYLKQHYLKVHADKCFVCDGCNKGFSTMAIKNNHSEICGVTFTCLDCPNTYSSYESLITHGRRKKHRIADRSVFMNKSSIFDLNKSASEMTNKLPLLLPKQSTSMQTIKFIPIVVQVKNTTDRFDKEIQTEPCTNLKLKHKSIKRRSTIHTQTCNKRKIRRSAETQTIGDCILKKAIQDAKVSIPENTDINLKKCTETQTKEYNWLHTEKGSGENISTQTGSSDTQKNSSDINLDSLSSEDLISSSSQTSVNSLDFFEDCSFANCQQTQTDILYQDDFLQSSSYISHIETQTNDEIDLCTNMYTQTCEDQLLSDFSNIQTQTNWPDYDLFVSTETQTLLTQNKFDIPMTAREISHMETQTDMEFKQLLEEINA